MTQSKFFSKDGIITGFELKGHSGAGHSGSDIVCAAVSSAAYMTANTITELYGFDAELSERDGFLRLMLSVKDARHCQELLKGFCCHLKELQKQYPHHIIVIYGGVIHVENKHPAVRS